MLQWLASVCIMSLYIWTEPINYYPLSSQLSEHSIADFSQKAQCYNSTALALALKSLRRRELAKFLRVEDTAMGNVTEGIQDKVSIVNKVSELRERSNKCFYQLRSDPVNKSLFKSDNASSYKHIY